MSPPALDPTGWLLRVVVVLITATAVLSSSSDSVSAIAQTAVAGLALAAWWSAEQTAPARSPRSRWLVPLSLTALACAGGVAATADHQAAGIGFAIVATISAGAELSAGWLLVVLALGALGIEVGAIAYGNTGMATILGLPAVLAGSALAGRYRRSYRLQAALAERARLAREIHDVLAHSLGALGIQLQTVEALLSDRGDIPGALERIVQAQRLVAEGLEETDRAVQALRTDIPPLPESLASLVAPRLPDTPSPGSLTVAGIPFALTPVAHLALLRVGQEALANVRKHAPDSLAAVRLSYTDVSVELLVTNALAHAANGRDDQAATAGGYGLAGMHERLRLIEGSLSAGPVDGQWVVCARVPR